jgi:processing peptidase subunit beta
VLTYGRRVPAVEVFARIDAVTLVDVTHTAARFAGPNNKIALAALGKIEKVPDFAWISGLFK